MVELLQIECLQMAFCAPFSDWINDHGIRSDATAVLRISKNIASQETIGLPIESFMQAFKFHFVWSQPLNLFHYLVYLSTNIYVFVIR
jgi:hypothetical protein